VFDYKFHTVFFLLTLLIGFIFLSHEISITDIVIYGEKTDKKKYNNGNFKVYNDYLIRDPSEYGIKETSNKPNQYDIPMDLEDRGSKIHSIK
jgi:hypothetical protein